MDDLPTDYDVIVLGTGMVECIFAAAAARVGKTVLHLDRNGYYGSDWASFNLDHLKKLSHKNPNLETKYDQPSDLSEGEIVVRSGSFKAISNFEEKIFFETEKEVKESGPKETESEVSDNEIVNKPEESTEDKPEDNAKALENNTCDDKVDWTWDKIFKEFRKFNLDLMPKLLFSRGDLVELLVSSNVARYAEYKCLTRILTFTDKLEQVPCSRADVFNTKHISIIDKRMLMQLLKYCLEANIENETEDLKNKKFCDFLKERKLTDNICHYVIHAIAMVSENANVSEGLTSVKKFLGSLGRFGNTPFLWPMYGSGELPQCFCRLCAVFGGTYCLRRSIESLIINKDGACVGVVSEGRRFNCKWLVSEPTYAPSEYLPPNIHESRVSRLIMITGKSIMEYDKEQISLLRLAPSTLGKTISVLELPPGSMVCPIGLHIVHATTVSDAKTAKEDLQDFSNRFFDANGEEDASDKPKTYYSVYFNLVDTTDCEYKTPQNMLLTSNFASSLDFDSTVVQARKLFHTAFPDLEFLPRAPDPEEIILEDDNGTHEESGGFANKQAAADESNQEPKDDSPREKNPMP